MVDKQAKEALAAEQAKTFGGIMADYFAMKLAGQRSGKAIRKRIEKQQLPVFKDTPIAEITDLDILAQVVNPRRVETPAMARSLFNELTCLNRWWRRRARRPDVFLRHIPAERRRKSG